MSIEEGFVGKKSSIEGRELKLVSLSQLWMDCLGIAKGIGSLEKL